MERRSGAPCFLYAVMRVLKVIESIWSIDCEPLTFFHAALHVLKVIEVVRNIDREPLAFVRDDARAESNRCCM
jgi:hypothetical protein